MESKPYVTENRWMVLGCAIGTTLAFLSFWQFLIAFLIVGALIGALEKMIFGQCHIFIIYFLEFCLMVCALFFGWLRK